MKTKLIMLFLLLSVYYCINRLSNEQIWLYEYILSYLLYVPVFCVLCLLFDPIRNIKQYLLKITAIPLFLFIVTHANDFQDIVPHTISFIIGLLITVFIMLKQNNSCK